jgi:hypothetical protein
MESSPRNQSGTPTEDIFAAAVERLEAGENLEEVLNSFGPEAEWLGPLIKLTAETRDLQETIAVPSSEASLNNFLLAAESLTLESSDGLKAGLLSRLIRSIGGRPLIGALVILILTLIVLGWGLRAFSLPALVPLIRPTTTASPIQTTTLSFIVGPSVTSTQTSLPVVMVTDTPTITPSPILTLTPTPTVTPTQFVETADGTGESIQPVESVTETLIAPPLTEITTKVEATSVLSGATEEMGTAATQPVETTPETEPTPEDDSPPQFLPTTGTWRDDIWRQIEIGFLFLLLGLGIKFSFRLIR